MNWLIFSILAAFCESMRDVLSKKNLRNLDEYFIAWALQFFGLLFLLPGLFFIEIPPLKKEFWGALALSGSLNVMAAVLYIKAIKYSDLSITVPMITFTPLFLLLTSPLIIHEVPTLSGILGVILIVIGAYILNIGESVKGVMVPFQALLREKGPQIMLFVAFVWSITSTIDKIGIKNSSPLIWSIAVTSFISISLFPIILFRSVNDNSLIGLTLRSSISLGLVNALAIFFEMTAYSLTLVAYANSIKRMSIVMSVIFGHYIFKEEGMRQRLLGTCIMLLGVILISVFH